MTDEPDRVTARQGAIPVALTETVVLVGLGLLVIFWLIPTQTSGNALGLEPAFMPTLYAMAFVALVVLSGVLHLAGWTSDQPLLPGSLRKVAPIVMTSGLGIAAFHFLGAAACGIVIVPATMLLLGERRWPLIVGTTAVGAIGLAIVFR